MAVQVPDRASPYAPQVLSPVPSQGIPDWLALRMRYARLAANGAAATPAGGPPAIAIVIDDLGDDVGAARRAIALPGAGEPGISSVPGRNAGAGARGRAGGASGAGACADGARRPCRSGPHGADAGIAGAGDRAPARLGSCRVCRDIPASTTIWAAASPSSRTALVPVIERLADRHVFFLDSRTTPQSQVVTLSRALGVASAARDVFLDDVETARPSSGRSRETESIARHEGVAIAIGHPHAVTLDALAAWTKQAASRGFELIAVSAAIKKKTELEIEKSSTANE